MNRRTIYCCVPQCNNYRKKGLTLHLFPTNESLRKCWETVLKLGKPSLRSQRVCSEHFTESDYCSGKLKKKLKRKLKKCAIPNKKLPVRYAEEMSDCESLKIKKSEVGKESKQNDIQVEKSVLQQFDPPNECNNFSIPGNSSKTDAVSQTYLCPIHLIITTEAILYTYTGLHSFQLLDGIIKCVSEIDNESPTNKKILNLRDRVLLTFVKLKLNLSFCTLEPLFGVSRHTCAKHFKKMIVLLSTVLECVIPWPDQVTTRRNLPVAFKNYRNTRIVIDCAETPVERSKCLKCRILTYSHYKKGHTVKFKLGVAPSGLITSVSKCYGGRASDKFITLKSHILDKMDVNDAVMTDKGFFIEKECLERHLILHQPPFLEKKKQLSRVEALKNAEIARARVHVERVIQRVKEFEVIGTKVAWSLLPYFDDCLIVACAVTNLSNPVLNIDKFM